MKDAMVIQEEQRQGEILETFFKEMKSYNMGGENWILVILMEVFVGALLCIPYQEVVTMEIWIHISMLSIYGTMAYMLGYMHFMESGKTHIIYEKIKYLPISWGTLFKWRMKRLLRFCAKRTCVFLGLQILFSLLCFREITIGNILYPLLIVFVIPVGVCSIPNYMKK